MPGVMLGVTAAVLVVAGCTSVARGSSAPTKAAVPPSTTVATIRPTTTTTAEEPGWTPVSLVNGAIAVDRRSSPQSTGDVITTFRFRVGLTRFNLHAGSSDPPTGAAMVAPDNGSTIGPHEAPLLLAAFNGGFKANAGVGGFELNGQVLVPLVPGAASLVIDTSGAARVGIWGQGVPVPGEQVASVRQNLTTLVNAGRPSPRIADIGAWGSTVGGVAAVARSALGEDAAGNLIYSAGMQALPLDLTNALVSAGATVAMQLDINPEWVQLASAPAPGAPLAAGIPGQNRPADQYQVGWTRDFVTVLAP
ncbi:MAG TPA: hypothetical protein VMV06_08070 [Acidimicrobiales bacterium]|nr:hypothetical protein [Acidimicrobiales bacterium]